MATAAGSIVLMGSGELTATMVEVHKEVLARSGNTAQAVFLDTPAGFQLNADHLSQKAVEYFQTRIHHPLKIASFRSKDTCSASETEQAYRTLRESDYVLIGPGSPTYAALQWADTPIPGILKKRIEEGGCLVAASAAALTVGCQTLPVYEIYKVGTHLHWATGIDILGYFGFDIAVIPHWNNAEGGTHDTRFCYMGEPRFRQLEALLPEHVSVLGLDEHTACIINFAQGVFSIRGIGKVTLRRQGRETVFEKGSAFPLDILRGVESAGTTDSTLHPGEAPASETCGPVESFWEKVHSLRDRFEKGLAEHAPDKVVSALLDLDGELWKAHQELDNQECITQAREILRDMIALIGPKLSSCPPSAEACLSPLVEALIDLRLRFRHEKKWVEADSLRDSLINAGIVLEDMKEGSRWHLK